jgi:hypothetical protein
MNRPFVNWLDEQGMKLISGCVWGVFDLRLLTHTPFIYQMIHCQKHLVDERGNSTSNVITAQDQQTIVAISRKSFKQKVWKTVNFCHILWIKITFFGIYMHVAALLQLQFHKLHTSALQSLAVAEYQTACTRRLLPCCSGRMPNCMRAWLTGCPAAVSGSQAASTTNQDVYQRPERSLLFWSQIRS